MFLSCFFFLFIIVIHIFVKVTQTPKNQNRVEHLLLQNISNSSGLSFYNDIKFYCKFELCNIFESIPSLYFHYLFRFLQFSRCFLNSNLCWWPYLLVAYPTVIFIALLYFYLFGNQYQCWSYQSINNGSWCWISRKLSIVKYWWMSRLSHVS